MNRARRFPPGLSGVKRALGLVADLRRDRPGDDEGHHAVGVEMRRGTRSRRVRHLDEDEITRWLTIERLPDHVSPPGDVRWYGSLRDSSCVEGCPGCGRQQRKNGRTTEASPAQSGLGDHTAVQEARNGPSFEPFTARNRTAMPARADRAYGLRPRPMCTPSCGNTVPIQPQTVPPPSLVTRTCPSSSESTPSRASTSTR